MTDLRAGFASRLIADPESKEPTLTFPEEFLRAQGWQGGDVLSFDVGNNQVFVTNDSKLEREATGV